MVQMKSSYKIKLFVFKIFLFFSVTGLYSCFDATEEVVLGRPQPVYEKNDIKSKIVNIFPEGLTLKVDKKSGDWFLIKEGSYKDKYLYNIKQPLQKEKEESNYSPVKLRIPASGGKDFNLRKISGRYAYSIQNGNTKKVLERLAQLEKRTFDIPSELPPVTMSGSDKSYRQVIVEIIEKTSILNSPSGVAFYPNLWSHEAGSEFSNHFLYYHYARRGYDNSNKYGEIQNRKIKKGQSLTFNGNMKNYSGEVTMLGVSEKSYIIIRNQQVLVLDKTRKKRRVASYRELLEKGKVSADCRQISAVTHMSGKMIVLLFQPVYGCEPGHEAGALFFDERFKLLNKFQTSGQWIQNVDFSMDGSLFFLRMGDARGESLAEKTDLIFNTGGKQVFKESSRLNKPVLYDFNFENNITFNHNEIQAYNIALKEIQIKKQTPIQFKKSWLVDVGNHIVAGAEGNTLQAFDLQKKELSSYFHLSQEYRFLSLSRGRFALLGSSEGSGTWSVTDLLNRQVCGAFYKGDIFSGSPNILIAFPKDDYYLIGQSRQRSKYIILGDCAGKLYKVKIFNKEKRIVRLSFKGASFLEISTDDGIYYVPIHRIITQKKEISI